MEHKHTCALTDQELEEIYDSMANHTHCWGFIVQSMIQSKKKEKRKDCLGCKKGVATIAGIPGDPEFSGNGYRASSAHWAAYCRETRHSPFSLYYFFSQPCNFIDSKYQ